jgi:hypothetical protein
VGIENVQCRPVLLLMHRPPVSFPDFRKLLSLEPDDKAYELRVASGSCCIAGFCEPRSRVTMVLFSSERMIDRYICGLVLWEERLHSTQRLSQKNYALDTRLGSSNKQIRGHELRPVS